MHINLLVGYTAPFMYSLSYTLYPSSHPTFIHIGISAFLLNLTLNAHPTLHISIIHTFLPSVMQSLFESVCSELYIH